MLEILTTTKAAQIMLLGAEWSLPKQQEGILQRPEVLGSSEKLPPMLDS